MTDALVNRLAARGLEPKSLHLVVKFLKTPAIRVPQRFQFLANLLWIGGWVTSDSCLK